MPNVWRPDLHPRDRLGRFVEVFREILNLKVGEFADLHKVLHGAENVSYARVHRTREGWEIRAQTATGTYGMRVPPDAMQGPGQFEDMVSSLDIARPFPDMPQNVLEPHHYDPVRQSAIGRMNLAKQARKWDPSAPGGDQHLQGDLYDLARERAKLSEERQMRLHSREYEVSGGKNVRHMGLEQKARKQGMHPYGIAERWLHDNFPNWIDEHADPAEDPYEQVDHIAERLREEDDGRPYEPNETPVFGDLVWLNERDGWAIVGPEGEKKGLVQVWQLSKDDPNGYKVYHEDKNNLNLMHGSGGFGKTHQELSAEHEAIEPRTPIYTHTGERGRVVKQVAPDVYHIKTDQLDDRLMHARSLYVPDHAARVEQPIVGTAHDDPIALFQDYFSNLDRHAGIDKPIGRDLFTLGQARQGEGDAKKAGEAAANLQDSVAKINALEEKAKQNPEDFGLVRDIAVAKLALRQATEGRTPVLRPEDVKPGDRVVISSLYGPDMHGEITGVNGSNIGYVQWNGGEGRLPVTHGHLDTANIPPIGTNLWQTGHPSPRADHTWDRGQVATDADGNKWTVQDVAAHTTDLMVVNQADGTMTRLPRYTLTPTGETVPEPKIPERPLMGDPKSVRSLTKNIRGVKPSTLKQFNLPEQFVYHGHDDAKMQHEFFVNNRVASPVEFASQDVKQVQGEIKKMLSLEPGDGHYDVGKLYDLSQLHGIHSATIEPKSTGGWDLTITTRDGQSHKINSGWNEPPAYWIENQLRWFGRGEPQTMRKAPAFNEHDVRPVAVYARQEAEDVRSVLDSIVGMDSVWDHNIDLEDMNAHGGMGISRPYGDTLDTIQTRLGFAHDVANQPRFHVVVGTHEMLHAYSARHLRGSMDEIQFQTTPESEGWEEGVVEGWASHLRERVAQRLGHEIDPQYLELMRTGFTAQTPYKPYVDALERVRGMTSYTPDQFYGELLRTPGYQRSEKLGKMTQGVTDRGVHQLMVNQARVTMKNPSGFLEHVAASKGHKQVVGVLDHNWEIDRSGEGDRQMREAIGMGTEDLRKVFHVPDLPKGSEFDVVARPDEQGQGYDLEASYFNPDGSLMGTFQHSALPGDRSVFLHTAAMEEGQRGQGLGRKMTKAHLEGFKSLNRSEVGLFAAAGGDSNGSYTWARFGWQFKDPETSHEMRDAFSQHLRSMRDQVELALDDGTLDSSQVEQIVQDLNQRFAEAQAQIEKLTHADEFANFRWAYRDHQFDTKRAMTTDYNVVNPSGGWDGTFDLADGSRSWNIFNGVNTALDKKPRA